MREVTIVSFSDYWSGLDADGKRDLAQRLYSSVAYLSQLAHGHRKPSRRMVDLARISAGVQLEFETCCEG